MRNFWAEAGQAEKFPHFQDSLKTYPEITRKQEFQPRSAHLLWRPNPYSKHVLQVDRKKATSMLPKLSPRQC